MGQSEYFRNLGFSIYLVGQRGFFDTAVVRTVLEFKGSRPGSTTCWSCGSGWGTSATPAFTLAMEIYRQDSDVLLTSIQGVYVGYDAGTGDTRRVPDEVRELVGHYEATGEVLPLTAFPALEAAARPTPAH